MVIFTNFNLLVTFSNLFLKKGFLNTNEKKFKLITLKKLKEFFKILNSLR